jgi:integrase
VAFLHPRKRKGGTYYYLFASDGTYLAACGRDRDTAKELLQDAERTERLARRGIRPDPICLWTLGDLRDRDLKDARARGREMPSRERRWRGIIARLGADTSLDAITATAIEQDATARLESGVTPATINRDRSLLRTALAFARRHKEVSGYTADPFADIAPLKESATRRRTKALDSATAERLIRKAWEMASFPPRPDPRGHGAQNVTPQEWAQNAAIVELIYRTASRVSQILGLRKDQVQGRRLTFPSHKRGLPRSFEIPVHLSRFLVRGDSTLVFPGRSAGPRREFRRFWRALCANAGVSGVSPRSLRKSAGVAMLEDGNRLSDLQLAFGHTTMQTTDRFYAEVFPRSLKLIGPVHMGLRSGAGKRAKPGPTKKRKPAELRRFRSDRKAGRTS